MEKSLKNKLKLSALSGEQPDNPFVIAEGKYRFGQLKDSSYYTGWTEHAFISDASDKQIVGRTFRPEWIRYIATFAFLFLAVLVIRAGWLQIVRGDYYATLADSNRLRVETIEARRGIIYDKNLTPLVRNQANFVLSLLPISLPKDELERDRLIRRLGLILDGEDLYAAATPSEGSGLQLASDSSYFLAIKEKLSGVSMNSLESYQPVFIADNIPYDQAMLLKLEAESEPSIFVSVKTRREYPFVKAAQDDAPASLSLAHVLGYTGKINQVEMDYRGNEYSALDYLGKAGLEYSWESELRGHNGRKNIEVDALGREKSVVSEEAAIDGYNLKLSLDLSLQQKAEEVTRAWLDRLKLAKASVIIMDPQNGEIMALVSLPGYDSNLFAKGISQADYDIFLNDPNHPLLNRSVSGEYPSGSVIKPVIALAALEERVITDSTSFVSNGGLRIGQWFFPDWKAGGHGTTNVYKAIAESVNTFFYYIGGGYQDFAGLGLERLVQYLSSFGLGEPTGIDINSEASGFVPSAKWKEEVKGEQWYIGDTYHLSIGQGDLIVTPLQIATVISGIANGGTVYRPHLVSQLLDKNNNVVREQLPEVQNKLLVSEENIQIVRQAMRQTVTSGSARSLSDLPVEVAGKTGTAQWSSKAAPHAWFVGFAPFDDPELLIVVMVEEGEEGSTVSVPIAKEILNWYFRDYGASSTDALVE